MGKFKVGDIVKGIDPDRYAYTNTDMYEAEVIETNSLTWSDADIRIKVLKHKFPWFIGKKYHVNSKYFKLVKHKPIVIYQNGNKVIAENKSTGEKGIAKCSPEDTFDFNIGAKIAFDRLVGRDITLLEDVKYYNGKVVCIDNKGNDNIYTLGKIYQFVDGNLTDDSGFKYPSPTHRVKSFDEWEAWTSAKFIEVVE